MREPLLAIENVTMQFGGLKAVCDLDLSIRNGELVGLIGPNGAGKTTVFNVITGVYAPTQGRITFEGHTISGMKANRIACGGITRTFQNIRLFSRLSCLDNVCVATHPHRKAGLAAAVLRTPAFERDERALKQRAMEMLAVLGLEEHALEPATSLAYGQQRRLEIARAMCTAPEMICLDEPAAGLNPVETATLSRIIRFLRQHHGITVLLIEHDMGMVMEISDRVIVLDHGDVIARGTPQEIQHNEAVIAAYLGADEEELAG
jgi:branched-chain amino acid transport system ATP-binding protein